MLFEEQLTRKPNLYPWTTDFIEAMQDGLWTAKKFSFDSDVNDYRVTMTPDQRQLLVRSLAAIAQIEVNVKEFWKRVGDVLKHPSIKDLGIVMAYIEVVHNTAYEKLLDRLGLGDVFRENMNVPAIAGRVGYLSKHADRVYADDRRQFIYGLILFTLFVENVSLFSQFYVVLWMNRATGMIKDAAQQVKYTRNEESLHAQAGMKIINTLRAEYPELFDAELERKIIHETHVALGAECELVNWMVGDFHGIAPTGETLNAALLKGYVAQRFNESLVGIGYAPVFAIAPDVEPKTRWMKEGVLAPARVDFFNTEPTSYQEGDTTLDDDF